MCGSETPDFPPRDQPFDFRVQLEAKYRDGLRRTASSTYVDTEGDIDGHRSSLRYRVSSCSHTDSVSKVSAQIDGRGVQPDCRPTTGGGTGGTTYGSYTVT